MDCIFKELCESQGKTYTFRFHCPSLGKEWENLIICNNCLLEFLEQEEKQSFNNFARKKLNEIIPKMYFRKLEQNPGERNVL